MYAYICIYEYTQASTLGMHIYIYICRRLRQTNAMLQYELLSQTPTLTERGPSEAPE